MMDHNELLRLLGEPTADAETLIQQKLQECADMLNYTFPLPSIEYDLKGHTAGYAFYHKNLIKLNAELLHTHPDEMIQQTLPHEFAHIASYKIYGEKGKGHGIYWQHVMLSLGLEPTRCHQMETTPARQTQKFTYVCPCSTHQVGLHRHKKIQRGAVYTCRRCKHPIRYQPIGE